jgi:hypothetical protein
VVKNKVEKFKVTLNYSEVIEFYQLNKYLDLIKKYNFFFTYSLKQGKKLKINNILLKFRCLVKQITIVLNYKFRKNLTKFCFSSLQNVLNKHFQIYLTKDFKARRKERSYFYVFLEKKNREKEIFK